MAQIEKTVFISYRRSDVYTALAVYENLKNQGYDVFFDYRSISSGDFEQIITSNIRARAHFLLVLTPTALDRCNEPGDWLRREIETAIDEKRNIVPLFFKGFRFGAPASSGKSDWFRSGRTSVSDTLTGKLKNLSRYNGLNVHEDYFDEAMYRLRTEYLSKPLDTVLHPVSTEVRRVVREEQIAADKALEQIEDFHELVKQDHEGPVEPKAQPGLRRNKSTPSTIATTTPHEDSADQPGVPPSKVAVKPEDVIQKETQDIGIPGEATEKLIGGRGFNFRLVGGIVGGLLVIGLLIWSASKRFQNLPAPTPEPTQTLRSDVSMMISEKDGMTLLSFPAGEFMMGSDDGADDAKPVHSVYLDAFWIDQTEVTNEMYAQCVQDEACDSPIYTGSSIRESYYGDSKFENYPVIEVSWDDAKTYCEWAGRRLPTEAEWEKAARGTDERIYPWGNSLACSFANFGDCVGDTTEVSKYPKGASPYGLLDMAGNVSEWVNDWYDANYYATLGENAHNPQGPASGQYRVLRGGSWGVSYGSDVHSAARVSFDPLATYAHVGFRCALSENQQVSNNTTQETTPGSQATCTFSENASFVTELQTLINNARSSNGLATLTRNDKLSDAARVHSIDMACNNYMGDIGSDASTPAERVAEQGLEVSLVIEAIYALPPIDGGNPQAAINSWMNSPSDRTGLLNSNITEFGIAYVFNEKSLLGGYFTVVFARP